MTAHLMGRAGPWLLIGDGAGWAHECSLSSCSSSWPHPAVIHSLTHLFTTHSIHSLTQSFIYSLVYSFTHSLTHSVHSLTYSYSFTHSFVCLLICSFTHSFSYSFIHSFIYSPTHSFPRKFARSSIHSFPDSLIHIFTLEERPLLGTDLMRRFLTRLH